MSKVANFDSRRESALRFVDFLALIVLRDLRDCTPEYRNCGESKQTDAITPYAIYSNASPASRGTKTSDLFGERMLNLHSDSSAAWLQQVDESLEDILIDHAHCEHKAAATAMSLMGSYIENQDLCEEMTRIVEEELEHFHMVLKLLQSRGIEFCRQQPGHYGKSLKALARPHEPQRAVDRLLIAGLIEARSCERFNLLADHVQDQELAEFYRSLFESEARHHTTYVRLAKTFAPDEEVRARLKELSEAESEIIHRGNALPRMHS